MRTGRLLACVAAFGLTAGFSCAAHSDQGTRADSKAQSGNSNSTGDEKKVSVSAEGSSVEVKKSGDGSAVEVKGSDGSVTIGENGIKVSTTDESQKGSADDVVKISGVNQNQTLECKSRSFYIAGTSNTVKLTGQCQNLKVSGTSNHVDVEGVAAINVSGIRNQVTWERGVNNKPPSISNSGINNSVSQKGN